MNKIQTLHTDLSNAFQQLKETQTFPQDQIHQDATIQRFEFTFELSWKLMQSVATYHGIDQYGPRNAIRAAAQLAKPHHKTRTLV